MFQVIKPGGKVVSVAGAPEPQTAMKDLGGRRFLAALFWLVSMKPRAKARRAGVAYRFLFMQPSRPGLELLSSLIDQGRLKITIDRAVPFDRIAEAMAYLESGRAKGKVVVQMV
jgi:NADPH:quinone reductase-like Zn-dependent oxidoreductase